MCRCVLSLRMSILNNTRNKYHCQVCTYLFYFLFRTFISLFLNAPSNHFQKYRKRNAFCVLIKYASIACTRPATSFTNNSGRVDIPTILPFTFSTTFARGPLLRCPLKMAYTQKRSFPILDYPVLRSIM